MPRQRTSAGGWSSPRLLASRCGLRSRNAGRSSPAPSQAERLVAEAEHAERARLLKIEQEQREARVEAAQREAAQRAQALAAAQAAEQAARRAAELAAQEREREEQRRRVTEERLRRGLKTVSARFAVEVSVESKGGDWRARLGVDVSGTGSAVEDKCEAGGVEDLRQQAQSAYARLAASAVCEFGNNAFATSLLGAGPLAILDDAEFAHWQRLLRVQLEASALQTLLRLCAETEVMARRSKTGASRSAELQLAFLRDVAPVADSASMRGRLERAVLALHQAQPDACSEVLRAVAADEQALLTGLDARRRSFFAVVLTLAHFLDRAAGTAGAQELCSRFVQEALVTPAGSWESCFLDRGGSPSAAALAELSSLLGESHPLTRCVAATLPKPAQVHPAEEEEWPDEARIRAARVADAQAAAPVPERVWAMRNAAATLALTGAREQALALLRTAVEVEAAWVGGSPDPRLLGALCDLHSLLAGSAEAGPVAERIVVICTAIADARLEAGDAPGAALLLASVAAEYGGGPEAAVAVARLADVEPEMGLVRRLAEAHQSVRGRVTGANS